MGRQTLPRAMGVSLAGLAFSPSPASLIASPRFAHAVAMRVRLISTSRRPIGTRVSDAVLLTAPSPLLRDGGRALSLVPLHAPLASQSALVPAVLDWSCRWLPLGISPSCLCDGH